jgi:uncharacterized membrane protein
MTATNDQMEEGADSPPDTEHERAPAGERLWEIDALRGVAIIMMVIYHFTYDLDQFGDFDIGANTGNWQRFANFTAFMFVFLVGISLVLSYNRARATQVDEWPLARKYLLRGARIYAYGMLITIVVWLAQAGGSIIFGILHLIGASIIFAYPFLRWPNAALPVGAGLVVLGWFMGYPRVDFPWLIWLGFRPEGIGSMFDYRPMIPWFGVALLGIYAGSHLYRDGMRRFPVPDLGSLPIIRGLSRTGRYSLAIYLIHQPVILLVLELTGVIDLGLF